MPARDCGRVQDPPLQLFTSQALALEAVSDEHSRARIAFGREYSRRLAERMPLIWYEQGRFEEVRALIARFEELALYHFDFRADPKAASRFVSGLLRTAVKRPFEKASDMIKSCGPMLPYKLEFHRPMDEDTANNICARLARLLVDRIKPLPAKNVQGDSIDPQLANVRVQYWRVKSLLNPEDHYILLIRIGLRLYLSPDEFSRVRGSLAGEDTRYMVIDTTLPLLQETDLQEIPIHWIKAKLASEKIFSQKISGAKAKDLSVKVRANPRYSPLSIRRPVINALRRLLGRPSEPTKPQAPAEEVMAPSAAPPAVAPRPPAPVRQPRPRKPRAKPAQSPTLQDSTEPVRPKAASPVTPAPVAKNPEPVFVMTVPRGFIQYLQTFSQRGMEMETTSTPENIKSRLCSWAKSHSFMAEKILDYVDPKAGSLLAGLDVRLKDGIAFREVDLKCVAGLEIWRSASLPAKSKMEHMDSVLKAAVKQILAYPLLMGLPVEIKISNERKTVHLVWTRARNGSMESKAFRLSLVGDIPLFRIRFFSYYSGPQQVSFMQERPTSIEHLEARVTACLNETFIRTDKTGSRREWFKKLRREPA